MERFRPDAPATPAVVVLRPHGGSPDPTDPGRGAFAFGASFKLDDLTGVSDTDNGDNLVQRGIFSDDTQYKIQLDDQVPTCLIRGSEGMVTVRASQPVRTDQWYRARCRRVGNDVNLRVTTWDNGSLQSWETSNNGDTGSLSYGGRGGPFSIGGKVDDDGAVLARDSDQFNGLIDDVFFRQLS
jgi:hypothetical protein